MNGLDKITARIESDAAAEAAAIAAQTAEQCEALRAEYEERAQQRYWSLVSEGVKRAEERVEQLSKAADMEARKTILAFRRETVDAVFDEARARLAEMKGAEYTDFLVRQAVAAAPDGQGELIFNASDAKKYGAKVVSAANKQLSENGVHASLVLSGETGDFSGGLIVRCGKVSVTCTTEALLAQAREELSSTVAHMLFD